MTQNPQKNIANHDLFSKIGQKSINMSQLNNSTSKAKYSIPKASRFPEVRKDGKSDILYTIPDTKTERSTSFGYGKKSDWSKQYFKKPPPGQHQSKSQFDLTTKQKGITLGAGREIVKCNSVFEVRQNIPGPAQYTPINSFFNQNKKDKGYSISGKIIDKTQKRNASLPGPGAYDTIQLLDKNLKTSNSRIENVHAVKFSKQKRKSQFEDKIRQNIPSPSQYSYSIADQRVAKFKGRPSFSFNQSQREGIVHKSKLIIPGPGAYQSLTEFTN